MAKFFQDNLDIVFFINGLVFMIMAFAIVLQSKHSSKFKIANALVFLACFGFLHGLSDWIDMWAIIKDKGASIVWLAALYWSFLIASFYCLFEFGRNLLRVSVNEDKKEDMLKYWLSASLTLIIIFFGYRAGYFWETANILTRYIMGLPSAILTSISLFIYYRREIRPVFPGLRVNFYCLSAAFFLYGISTGLVVNPGDFFPANIINTRVFLNYSGGIPIQLIRALIAAVITVLIGRILVMFRWEIIKNLCTLETERFTDKVTSSVEEMIMVVDKDFRIKWANAKLKATYGKDILNAHCYKITHHIDEPCRVPNDICPIAEVTRTNKPVTVVHTHFDRAGNSIYAEVSAYPMLDEKGRSTGDYVHTSRDVTQRIKEQKELEEAYIELKAIQEKLLAAEKMASLGKLSAGIAHEINNPIGFVVSNLSTLEKYISNLLALLNVYYEIEAAVFKAGNEEPEKLYQRIKDFKKTMDFEYLLADIPKLINETLDGAQRVVRIIRDLKSFSRKDEIEFTEAKINELVETALNIVWNEVKYKADVVKEYGELPLVSCHPQQITQALMNIIVNGAQSIEKSGKITIRTYVNDDKVFIEISDSGGGMSEETQKRLFEPFFTTKKVGDGTGLGLAIVYGIIQNHKGNIEVKSRPGEGSNFIISLPIKAEKEKKAAKQ